jgi:phospholipid/cholesterol/gamma-HCH transport system substrate-binding protein
MKRAIKNHLVDFIAIIVLVLLAIVVSGYVLSKERLQLPFIGTSQYTINAEFSTGQAVMPGQGQTVRVSGVQIGDVGNVNLNGGVATIQLDIDKKYSHIIHTDATALLRPKTGLKDMFVEINPGSSSAPIAKPGFTIPVSNTNPDVNPDEVLASLDADTREYLDLLINGAGQGLQGKGGSELAKVLERFLPTHRDLARLNQVVAERGAALRSLIHSLQVLNTALATKQNQIVQLVDSSSKVFHAFALANQGVSRAVADLPGTLDQTTATLQKVQRFAQILAPATRNLLPAVREIPAANAATIALAGPNAPSCGSQSTCQILRDQIRPFVRTARPFVRNLKPAAVNLGQSTVLKTSNGPVHLGPATSNLSNAFTVLNHLFNILGYSPGGSQHGYLWWLAWLDHNARTLFSVQDANGDFRPLFLQASCASWSQIVQNQGPLSVLVLNLLPILGNTGICPGGSSALPGLLRAYDRQVSPRSGKNAGAAHMGGAAAATNTLSGAVGALSNVVNGTRKTK